MLFDTDFVALGIVFVDISMVIYYDVPHDSEYFVHRIGRTARADHDGIAITLVRGKEVSWFMQIEKFLGYEVEKMPLPKGLGKAPEYKIIKPKDKNTKKRGDKPSNNRKRPRRRKSKEQHK